MAYTTIDDPSAHFQTTLYTGNRSSSQTITNDGNSDLKPDWLWIKPRNDTVLHSHSLFDSTRGVTKGLASNLSEAEYTTSSKVTSFNTDGFSIGNGASVNQPDRDVNYVTWQWKANGGTTTTNDASATGVGTIDSVYQANTTAGFSIVTYTGTTSAGTIAHGLGAVPKMIIIKNRDDGAENWAVYHAGIASDAETDYMYLDTNNAAADDANLFNDTAPTSTVFSIGTSGVVNQAEAHVAYCFAEIKGYSKFGSYTGNGSTDGTFVYTGFRPAFIMARSHDNAEGWNMIDNKREGFNVNNDWLSANSTAAENDGATYTLIDILSNGFKWRNADINGNGSGRNCLYMAFAEHPFVSSEGVPVTAR